MRRMGAVGAVILLTAWSAAPLGYLAREAFLEREASGPASGLDIGVQGRERKACHHHPAGCPKECLCPNSTAAGEHPENRLSLGDLSAPALTHCTENASGSDLWFGNLLFPFSPWELTLHESASALKSAASRPPADRFPDPPRKIPIA